MVSEEIEKSTEFYKEKIISLDQAIPNAILLTSSVIVVFLAGQDTTNLLLLSSLLLFALAILFSITSLRLLKNMALEAYNNFMGADSALEKTKERLKKEGVADPAYAAQEFEKALGQFNTGAIAKMRNSLNKLQNFSYLSFLIGMTLLLFGTINIPGGIILPGFNHTMNPYFLSLIIFSLAIFIVVAFVSGFGIKNLFPGSGDPASVSKSFSKILGTFGQTIIGLIVVLSIVALLIENRVSSETAMPIISLISGYILGRGMVSSKKD